MLLTNSMEAACYLPTVWRLHVTYQQVVLSLCRFSASSIGLQLVMETTPELAKDAVFPCVWRSLNAVCACGQLDE